MLFSPSAGIVAVKPKREFLKPLGYGLDVASCTVCWNGAFDNGKAIFVKVIAPIAICGGGVWKGCVRHSVGEII
jgi:hypothetical protein